MPETNKDEAMTIGLQSIGWIVADEARGQRFLALTGLTPDDLRNRITDPGVLDAAFGFLEGHQADLIACADAIEVSPDRLAGARQGLFA